MDDDVRYSYEMDDNRFDDFNNNSYPDSDLQQTQSTQQASQQSAPENNDSHLWGYLQPCSGGLTRIDFWKIHPCYTIGRNTEFNSVVFPGFKISNHHCAITWDGFDTMDSLILVEDKSSNGTFINGEKVGRGCTRMLKDGNEIAFGTCVPQAPNSTEDYRFIYRHTAGGPPTKGFYSQYDVGSELGKGSFATVLRAVHRFSGQLFAVKVIHPTKVVGQSKTPSETLVREISIMEKLNHRNICKLYEVYFQSDKGIYLVLELVGGGDLLDYIMANNGISELNTRDITYQMCNALKYIHLMGVTHRDLKPENVLLTKHRPPIIKIADFGLAKVVDDATMLRTLCGTPSYLAPEVVSQVNEEGYDNRVDSWSVGVIVFAMISNSSPFRENSSEQGVKERILSRRIVWGPLQEKLPSREALGFIFALLQSNPESRMSIVESLEHPWLKEHLSFYPPDFDEYDPRYLPKPGASLAGSSSLGSAGSFGSSSNNSNSGAFGAPALVGDPVIPGRHHGGSPTSALRRRSEIVAEAAEKDNVAEPPREMAANQFRLNPPPPVAGPSSGRGGGGGGGGNKRAREELSVLPEDSLEQVYAEAAARKAAAAAAEANANFYGHGRVEDDEIEVDPPRRSSRRTKQRRG